MNTFDLREAADFLKMSPSALRAKAKAGLVRGAKLAKRWVFLEDDLVAYVRRNYPTGGQAPLSGCETEVSRCHSTNAVRSGGSRSPVPVGRSYDALLGLGTKNRPKNTMTI